MNRAVLVTVLAAGAVLGTAQPSRAQFQRYDYVWARNTNGAQLTLDGVLNEPQWAVADSIVIDGRQIGPIPGSGWKDEGGFAATDPNHSVIKFLLVGSQLWVGATVRDSSIGGSEIFNYFDGLLMSLKQHQLADRPAPPGEHFISWWWPSTSGDTQPRAINKPMAMTCVWRTGYQAPTPQQIQEWDARWTVDGTVNSDTLSDRGYTVEMRFDLGMNGYDVSKPGGEIVEWNVSI
ncbi:MAG TPA: hypothetical protein VMH61_08475, partial [Candidatus Acidoferrales bacterium]|nr:hypothetical protein [Candidatus Acidoferrales bacterium]